MIDQIPPEVAERLGFYVYIYIDPRTEKPFYVGKGQDYRVLDHLSDEAESRKVDRIRELKGLGLEPRLEVLAHALPSEEAALRLEAAIIDLLGLGTLTNEVRGWRSVQLGRMSLADLIIYYTAEPVNVEHPSLLIRVTKLYRHGMTPEELYEITRGVWKVGERRNAATYAMAVFDGIVREIYAIQRWHPAGTTSAESRRLTAEDCDGRWEFVGAPAEEPIRSKYLNRSVRAYFGMGKQNPVLYVGC